MSGYEISAHGDSSTGSELKADEEACRESGRMVEALNGWNGWNCLKPLEPLEQLERLERTVETTVVSNGR